MKGLSSFRIVSFFNVDILFSLNEIIVNISSAGYLVASTEFEPMTFAMLVQCWCNAGAMLVQCSTNSVL